MGGKLFVKVKFYSGDNKLSVGALLTSVYYSLPMYRCEPEVARQMCRIKERK